MDGSLGVASPSGNVAKLPRSRTGDVLHCWREEGTYRTNAAKTAHCQNQGGRMDVCSKTALKKGKKKLDEGSSQGGESGNYIGRAFLLSEPANAMGDEE